jgi:hypothetical protein
MDIIYYYWISFRSSEAHLGTFSAASKIKKQGKNQSGDRTLRHKKIFVNHLSLEDTET